MRRDGMEMRKKVEKKDSKKLIVNKSKVEDSNKPDLVSIHQCDNEFCGLRFYLSREIQLNGQECPCCGSENTRFSHVGRAPQIEFASSRSPEKFATSLTRERTKIGLICCICGDRIEIEESQLDSKLSCKRCNVKKDTFRLE